MSQSQLLSKVHDVALEMIDFQDTTLFKALTAIYAEMKELDQKSMASSSQAVAIEKTLFDMTGIKVEFTMDDNGAYCLPPIVDKNNPLIDNVMREWLTNASPLKMIEKAGGIVRGKVDLVHSKVSGVFSEMNCILNMPTYWVAGKFMNGGFSAAELAAITLHELGHLFTGFEFLWHSVTTNQVLAGVAKGLDQSADQAEREMILMSAAKALNLNEAEMKKLAESGTNKAATILVLQEVTRFAPSEIGTSIYDMNNWEQLADQFAARHGAQRDLFMALDKIHHLVGDISVRSTAKYVALEVVKVLLMFGTIGLATVAGPAAIIPFFIWTAMILIDGPGSPLYDRPGVRLKRIRDQLVEQIKDRDLGKDVVVRLKEDLVACDKLLETVKDRFQLITLVFGFFNSEFRDRLKQEKLQQELETLVANDLFVKSAELKTLF